MVLLKPPAAGARTLLHWHRVLDRGAHTYIHFRIWPNDIVDNATFVDRIDMYIW